MNFSWLKDKDIECQNTNGYLVSNTKRFSVINTSDGLGLKRRMHFLTHDHIIQSVSFLARKNFPFLKTLSLLLLKYLHSMLALMLKTNDQVAGRRGEIRISLQ